MDRGSQFLHDAADLRGARAEWEFLVRQHALTLHWTEITPWTAVGRVETGMVHEQTIRADGPVEGEVMELRRIRLDLDRPTEEKEIAIVLLTAIPHDRADAGCCARPTGSGGGWRTSSRR